MDKFLTQALEANFSKSQAVDLLLSTDILREETWDILFKKADFDKEDMYNMLIDYARSGKYIKRYKPNKDRSYTNDEDKQDDKIDAIFTSILLYALLNFFVTFMLFVFAKFIIMPLKRV